MSRHLLRSLVAAGALVWIAPVPALAQYPGSNIRQPNSYNPYARPVLSPYLNMLRGGSPSANYFLGVVPDANRQYELDRINRNLLDLERQRATGVGESDELLPTLAGTGHPTTFMTYGSYYNLRSAANPLGGPGHANQLYPRR